MPPYLFRQFLGQKFLGQSVLSIKRSLAPDGSGTKLVLGVFFCSILITLLFWATLPPTIGANEPTDYTFYHEPVARNILKGRGIVLANGAPATANPPGYAFILAGIFSLSHLLGLPDGMLLATFTLLCMGGVSVFVFLLARIAWGSLNALAGAFVWMTYPFALWLTSYPNSELSFLVIFYGSFYLLWRALCCRSRAWPFYFLSGMLIGMAMLIRAIAWGGGLLMAAIIWRVGRGLPIRTRLFLMSMILLANFLVILPWEVWLYLNTGQVVLLGTNGAPSLGDGLTFAVNSKNYRQAVVVPEDVAALMRHILTRSHNNQMETVGEIALVMLDEVQQRPLTVMKLFLIKIARSWYATDSGKYEIPIILIQIGYLAIVGWGSVVAWKQGGITRQLTLSIGLITLYFWGMSALVLSILRYMVPVIGLLFILLPGAFLRVRLRRA